MVYTLQRKRKIQKLILEFIYLNKMYNFSNSTISLSRTLLSPHRHLLKFSVIIMLSNINKLSLIIRFSYLIYHKCKNPIFSFFLSADSSSGLDVSYKFLHVFPSLMCEFNPSLTYLATFNLLVRPSIIRISAFLSREGFIFF